MLPTSVFAATDAWLAGELFESTLIAAYGVLSLALGLGCWQLGLTPAAKALWLPLVLTGLVYLGLGLAMQVSNRQRQPAFAQQFRQHPQQFIEAEQRRVATFAPMYTTSKAVATVVFLLTLGVFWFSNSSALQGWGIGLSLFAVVGLTVDFFSQERATTYARALAQAAQATSAAPPASFGP